MPRPSMVPKEKTLADHAQRLHVEFEDRLLLLPLGVVPLAEEMILRIALVSKPLPLASAYTSLMSPAMPGLLFLEALDAFDESLQLIAGDRFRSDMLRRP